MHSTVLLLLRRGADPNASSCPIPVLFFAVRSGDIEMVRLLLLNGAKPGVTVSASVRARFYALFVLLQIQFLKCFQYYGFMKRKQF